MKEKIRCPVAAGMFYPEYGNEILEYINAFVQMKDSGNLARAIIAPHGAWEISGSMAVDAFMRAGGRREITRVVLLGPIHDKREEGIFLSNSHFFDTPLGMLPVDREVSKDLEYYSEFLKTDDIPHLGEHSIEVLLPFVKYFFPDASIVPILMGRPSVEMITDLSQALRTVLGPVAENTLFVVSSCLSCSHDKTTARHLAEESVRLVLEKNTPQLISSVLNGRIKTCGGAIIASLLGSGLLDQKQPRFIGEEMVSAAEEDGDTVFYGVVSFE